MTTRDPAEVLLARARALARPAATGGAEVRADALDLLAVVVAGERLAIPLSGVAAIARVANLVPLPRAVPPVYGVTAWRGRPLTVLTLAPGAPALGDASRFVVLGDARRAQVAVLVDAVEDVVQVARTAFTPTVTHTRGIRMLGVTDDAMQVLDEQALFHGHVEDSPDAIDSTRTT